MHVQTPEDYDNLMVEVNSMNSTGCTPVPDTGKICMTNLKFHKKKIRKVLSFFIP
jgi:hypothetical protein